MSEVTTAIEANGTEQVDPATTDEGQQTFDAEYVRKLRAESAKYRNEAKANAQAAKQLAEIEEANKTELQKAQERADAAEKAAKEASLQALTTGIASTKGVPAEFLKGSTAEEIEAFANKLIAFRDASGKKPPRASDQKRNDTTPADDPLGDFAARLFKRD